uniref:Cytochrome c551/c552 n=1 Tax=Candidatus Kentrum sp. LFY TaxID=2126342 RepID=A0A450WMS9_9GAMM|nr:MAG: Cytochrome c551/c552 [Candidatus Kentron sp. LFY]
MNDPITSNGKGNGPILLEVLGFSLTLAFVFTLLANTLPQVEGEAPGEENDMDLGALTMDGFVAMGEAIFQGKGTCALCHNALGRAPDLMAMNVMGAATERLRDARYAGSAVDPTDYLRESLLAPSAYVVKGFGKKGSFDTESPMPNVGKPPIGLSDTEIDAVIAFLQAKDGFDVTIALPTEAPPEAEESVATVATAAPLPAKTPEEIIAKYGCNACHTVLDTTSPVGPSLQDVGARLSPEEIRVSIIDPAAVIAEGFPPIMPPDFADRMTVRELEMLVGFLAGQE